MDPVTVQIAASQRPGLVSVDGRTYPLESVRVGGRAEGGIGLTRLVQRFANPHDEALEVVYTMALPADGAAIGYVIRMGEKVIRGEIEPREQAEADYRKALYEGRTAGLLDQERADTFTQRLGNVPAHTGVQVEIEVLQPLAFLPGVDDAPPQWEYRFPTVVGVRYEGAPGRVGDAGKLDVNRTGDGSIPTRVELEMLLADARTPDAGIVSHGHDIRREPGLEGTLVSFAEGQRLDRDIVLRWSACTGDVGVRLAEGRGLEGDDGRYALLTIVPPTAPAAVFHRDLTVLIDASGSMDGLPLDLAKQVVGELLRSLEPGDRFELLAFANETRKLTKGLVDLDESGLAAALQSLERLQAGGGTEMLHAVEEALRPLRDDAQRQVVLVTDGCIGFEAEVVGRITKQSPRGARVHAVGVGSVPNRTLLSGVARAGRGAESMVGDETSVAAAAKRLRAATARPVLTDLAVAGDALAHCAAGALRDVFAGRPLVLPIELRPEGGPIVVTGRLAGAADEWKATLDVKAAGVAGGPPATPLPIGALYGREVVADLEIEMAAGRDAAGAGRRIERCAMRHRIVSRRTSLVAIAEEPSVDPKQPRRRERLAVELPAGVSAEGVGLVPSGPMMLSLGSESVRLQGTLTVPSAVRPWVSDGSEGAVPGFVAPPEELHIQGAGAVREPDGTLVLEFEVPFDGFLLPDAEVYVVVGGGFFDKALVVAALGSPRGPHGQGMVVRLALRLETEPAWPRVGTVTLRWSAEGPRPGEEPARVRLVLDIPLPPVGGETPRS
jgi:Ca-activated chloride channel homolog